jgi:hypothetical protein
MRYAYRSYTRKAKVGVTPIMGMLILWLYDVIKDTKFGECMLILCPEPLVFHFISKNVKIIMYAEYTFDCFIT